MKIHIKKISKGVGLKKIPNNKNTGFYYETYCGRYHDNQDSISPLSIVHYNPEDLCISCLRLLVDYLKKILMDHTDMKKIQ